MDPSQTREREIKVNKTYKVIQATLSGYSGDRMISEDTETKIRFLVIARVGNDGREIWAGLTCNVIDHN